MNNAAVGRTRGKLRSSESTHLQRHLGHHHETYQWKPGRSSNPRPNLDHPRSGHEHQECICAPSEWKS